MNFYFICYPHGPAEKAGYEHQSIAIAEGLKKLGINSYANVNYWKLNADSDEYLLNENKDTHYEESDVVVFSSVIYDYNRKDLLPENLFNPKRKYKLIFIDEADGVITPGFKDEIRNVDIVLKSHYCKKFKYPSNFIPWQFGLTNRIISSVQPTSFNDRNNEVLVNYRGMHPSRELAENKIMHIIYSKFSKNSLTDLFEYPHVNKQDELYWLQTGRRHYSSFYKRLGVSKVCAAFGGFPTKSFLYKNDFISKVMRKVDKHFHLFNNDSITQFDSWRFWESMASACVTIHIDFDKYGAVFPIMPRNKKHYIGIDFSNINKSKGYLQRYEEYESIANNAREWVLEFYSPEKIAQRLLDLIT